MDRRSKRKRFEKFLNCTCLVSNDIISYVCMCVCALRVCVVLGYLYVFIYVPMSSFGGKSVRSCVVYVECLPSIPVDLIP